MVSEQAQSSFAKYTELEWICYAAAFLGYHVCSLWNTEFSCVYMGEREGICAGHYGKLPAPLTMYYLCPCW